MPAMPGTLTVAAFRLALALTVAIAGYAAGRAMRPAPSGYRATLVTEAQPLPPLRDECWMAGVSTRNIGTWEQPCHPPEPIAVPAPASGNEAG